MSGRRVLAGCFAAAFATLLLSWPHPAAGDELSWLDASNVAWESPSGDSFGSMPLGNGDVGLNVWAEPGGDVLFYISKVDAFDSGHLLPKLGRVRLRFSPAMPVQPFRQVLILREGAIAIEGGDVKLHIWVDANRPVIRVQGSCGTARQLTVSMESLRPLAKADAPLPAGGTAGVLFDDKADRIAWCYRNQSSAWGDRLRSQNTPEMVQRAVDPILHRTSGCLMRGEGMVRDSASSLRTSAKVERIDCTIQVLSNQPVSLQEWLGQIEAPMRADREAHGKWWQAFWERSHIVIRNCGEEPVQLDPCRFTQFPQGSLAYRGHNTIGSAENARQITQRYALERFCEAIASRGAVPPPYNGSIFTMDMPAGTLGFDAPKPGPTSPDGRDWAVLSFMWQNTRHPYWAMAARGDYDTMRPGMQFVRDGLDICRDRCRKIFTHDGAFIMEASWWHNVGVFDWNGVPAHLRYHFLASIELPAIMCEYYEHTRDRRFLDEVLLPCADEFIKFYELQFPNRDARGKMVMEPAATVETYQPVTNPNTEVTGLRHLLGKLIGFDIGNERKAHWTKLLAELPDTPLRRIRGMDLLAVGDRYAPGRVICESPEMYSVYPFRQAWIGNDALLATGRQSFHVRNTSLDGTVDDQAVETGGWQAAAVQAAYLGLGREAARLASINFNDQFIHWTDNIDPSAPWPNRPRPRFPAFWECKMDGTPDNDHGANSANAMQSMLLQSDAKKIYLLPAWPEDWDVTFTLHAPANTTVECEYASGKVRVLKVTPAERSADVIDLSSETNRIRTLVRAACADRNYLFDLPPMLDGALAAASGRLPRSGTWVKRFGESLLNTRGGPWEPAAWGGSVFRDNVVYVHVLDWPEGGITLAKLPVKLRGSRSLTGTASVVETEGEIVLKGSQGPAEPDTIVRLEFDSSIEPIAMSVPYRGSLTAGRKVTASSFTPGNEPGKATDADGTTMWIAEKPEASAWIEVDLGRAERFDRAEIYIHEPGHRRNQSRAYSVEYRAADGSWKPCVTGAIYGSICGRRFEPVTAQFVRLNTAAPGVKQFDLFPPGR